jgi:hypothetical protein
MAKIFNNIRPEEPEDLPIGNNRKVSRVIDIIFKVVVALFLIIIMFFIVIKRGEKKEINKDKGIMGLEKLIIMKNGNILTKQVKYETSKKSDPKDTSDIFFEVVNGDEEYLDGDLVKFNHRFIQPQQIEGAEYCVLDPKQIQFKIKKEDVKRDLLKG